MRLEPRTFLMSMRTREVRILLADLDDPDAYMPLGLELTCQVCHRVIGRMANSVGRWQRMLCADVHFTELGRETMLGREWSQCPPQVHPLPKCRDCDAWPTEFSEEYITARRWEMLSQALMAWTPRKRRRRKQERSHA